MGDLCVLWEILPYILANAGSSGRGQKEERESYLGQAEYILILWQK